MLGDSAYPLSERVLTPYRDNGHLTDAQVKFNKKLSTCRIIIEHSFGILKQQFRQLYYCKLKGMAKLNHFVRACCVLHNLLRKNNLELSYNMFDEPLAIQNNNDNLMSLAAGKNLRDKICNDFYCDN